MDVDLQAFLTAHPAHHETTETWPIQGQMKVRLGLASVLPPVKITSSILSIVVNSDRQVLFLWPQQPTGSIAQVLIGGRSRENETPEETIIREVGEETGWRIMPQRIIGFRHFSHLEPRSEKSDRPYPDFIQPVFSAPAFAFDSALLLPEDEVPVEFIDFAIAERTIDSGQRPLLRAAIEGGLN